MSRLISGTGPRIDVVEKNQEEPQDSIIKNIKEAELGGRLMITFRLTA